MLNLTLLLGIFDFYKGADLISVNGERNHEMENSYLSFFYVTNIYKKTI